MEAFFNLQYSLRLARLLYRYSRNFPNGHFISDLFMSGSPKIFEVYAPRIVYTGELQLPLFYAGESIAAAKAIQN